MRSILFIDRDGTLIEEPPDFQIDSVEKFKLLPSVIPSLLRFRDAGFEFVMITNQDGLGNANYPQSSFDLVQTLLLSVLESQGIRFSEILICPHLPSENCACRKPKTQLVSHFLAMNELDRTKSYVLGDRSTDLELASNMGLKGFRIGPDCSWTQLTHLLLDRPRTAEVVRKTSETSIRVHVDLDGLGTVKIKTGIGFFDHMLEQIAKHGGFDMELEATGDLHIDEHHLVEDVALSLGEALRRALGDKRGIQRYGFVLPMDESLSQVAIDLSGRPFCQVAVSLPSAAVGGLSREMISHFFSSLSQALGMSLHLTTTGENSHHMVESMFKSVGRCLRQALSRDVRGQDQIPSSKGAL